MCDYSSVLLHYTLTWPLVVSLALETKLAALPILLLVVPCQLLCQHAVLRLSIQVTSLATPLLTHMQNPESCARIGCHASNVPGMWSCKDGPPACSLPHSNNQADSNHRPCAGACSRGPETGPFNYLQPFNYLTELFEGQGVRAAVRSKLFVIM